MPLLLAILRGVGLVAVVAVLLWDNICLIPYFRGTRVCKWAGREAGKARGDGKAEAERQVADNSQKTLFVRVEGNSYFIEGKQVSRQDILDRLREGGYEMLELECGRNARTLPFDLIERDLKQRMPHVVIQEAKCH